jgi:hypothetical protein
VKRGALARRPLGAPDGSRAGDDFDTVTTAQTGDKGIGKIRAGGIKGNGVR